MRLLERSSLLQQLQSLLQQAAAGQGRLAALCGEAGAGKSTVAEAVASRAGKTARVLWGACEDLSTAEPLGPLHDLARSASWSMPVFGGGASRQHTLFGEVLKQLAAKPTLVVLEDLHWADDATLDFVRFLGRRISATPLMLLVTARNDTADAQSRLRRALVDVAPDVLTRFDVPRLSEAAVRELARDHGRDAMAMYALTGGNAFLVTEVLRSGEECPPTVRDALLLRADRLSAWAREAIGAASIFPRRVEAWLLEAVLAGVNVDGLSESMAAGMLTFENGCYAFRHEIARRAIEESLAPSVRTRLNERALEALRRRMPAATARLVHHAIEARDANAVVTLAPLAASEAARVGAHRQAARHYEAALGYADLLPREQRAELLEMWAFELQLTGRVGEALDVYKAALALRRELGDELRAGDDMRWISRLSYNVGDRAAAVKFGEAAVAALESFGARPELAMAYANLALILAIMDEYGPAIEWANRALELADRLERLDIRADVLASLGAAQQWVDHDAARRDFARSLELALALKREELAARVYSNASCIEFNFREGARAHKLMEQGLAYCTERDLDTWAGYIRGWLAELLIREGKWREAGEEASRVLQMAGVTRLLRFPAVAAMSRLVTRTGAGDASELLDELLTFGAEPQRLLIYAPIVAEHAWVTEAESSEALRLLHLAAPIAQRVGNPWAAGEIAYWRAQLDDNSDIPATLAQPYRLQFAGDWRGAAAAWAELPAPYDQALALLEGDEEGRAQGLALLDSLGASAVAERVRKALRQRGVRGVTRGPRPSTRSNPAGLTHRQMQVLRLIDEGLSNNDIAQKLCLSPKTVDHHVSAILEKLEAATRGEAAARARKANLLGG